MRALILCLLAPGAAFAQDAEPETPEPTAEEAPRPDAEAPADPADPTDDADEAPADPAVDGESSERSGPTMRAPEPAPDASPEPVPFVPEGWADGPATEADPAPPPASEPEPEPEPAETAEPVEAVRANRVNRRQRRSAELGAEPRLQLSAEIGSLGYPGENYQLFASSGRMPVRGLRLGVRPIERLVVEGAWSHGGRGAAVTIDNDTSNDFSDDRGELYTAYTLDSFTLGVRVDVPVARRVLYPYIAGRGALQAQGVRLDDDLTDPESVGQTKRTTTSPGYEVVGGIELRTPQGEGHFAVAWTLEMGRAAMAEAQFADLGTLEAHGFLVRTGLGVRY